MATGDLDSLPVTVHDDGTGRYTTIDGDVVGQLCCRYYGQEWDTTEAVLAANPGLARRGTVLPAGVEILFPKFERPSNTGVVSLYDP